MSNTNNIYENKASEYRKKEIDSLSKGYTSKGLHRVNNKKTKQKRKKNKNKTKTKQTKQKQKTKQNKKQKKTKTSKHNQD